MERVQITPRPNWQAKVEDLGFSWHTPDGRTYWDESAYWKFSDQDIAHIQSVVNDGYGMLTDAINYVISTNQLPLFGYSEDDIRLIESSWANRVNEPTLFGRFDLAFDGTQAKILEFNGDGPVTLFETSMVQRSWLQDLFANDRQLNSVHERLVAHFRQIAVRNNTQLRDADGNIPGVHITCFPSEELESTAVYLQNVANEAGLLTKLVRLPDIGWDGDDGYFFDDDDQEISTLIRISAPLFQLRQDNFGQNLTAPIMDDDLRIVEPAWRMLATNKRLLAVMWERNAYHPALLNTATSLTPDISATGYARKPYNGLDGQNITLIDAVGAEVDATVGDFENDQFIYQERANIPEVDGNFVVIGAWMIDDGAVAGLSVREAETPITDSAARFVPHLIG